MTREEKIKVVDILATYLDNYYLAERNENYMRSKEEYQRFIGLNIFLCDIYRNAEEIISDMQWDIGINGMLTRPQVVEYADKLSK